MRYNSNRQCIRCNFLNMDGTCYCLEANKILIRSGNMLVDNNQDNLKFDTVDNGSSHQHNSPMHTCCNLRAIQCQIGTINSFLGTFYTRKFLAQSSNLKRSKYTCSRRDMQGILKCKEGRYCFSMNIFECTVNKFLENLSPFCNIHNFIRYT